MLTSRPSHDTTKTQSPWFIMRPFAEISLLTINCSTQTPTLLFQLKHVLSHEACVTWASRTHCSLRQSQRTGGKWFQSRCIQSDWFFQVLVCSAWGTGFTQTLVTVPSLKAELALLTLYVGESGAYLLGPEEKVILVVEVFSCRQRLALRALHSLSNNSVCVCVCKTSSVHWRYNFKGCLT